MLRPPVKRCCALSNCLAVLRNISCKRSPQFKLGTPSETKQAAQKKHRKLTPSLPKSQPRPPTIRSKNDCSSRYLGNDVDILPAKTKSIWTQLTGSFQDTVMGFAHQNLRFKLELQTPVLSLLMGPRTQVTQQL